MNKRRLDSDTNRITRLNIQNIPSIHSYFQRTVAISFDKL
jgi:hypothetical protein